MGSDQVRGVPSTLNAEGTTTVPRSPASASFGATVGATACQNIAF